jgi:hypothetical protein
MLLMSAIAALISARLAGLVAHVARRRAHDHLSGLCFPLAVVYTRVACGLPPPRGVGTDPCGSAALYRTADFVASEPRA